MSAADLWTAVKESYSNSSLLQLTNVRSVESESINDAAGENAAQTVIDLFPAYAQVDFDIEVSLHVTVGKMGVIAILQDRAGTTAKLAKVRWDSVFSAGGLISKVKNTDPRGHAAPETNSKVSSAPETRDGSRNYGWSDRAAVPEGILPRSNRAR